jgi:hypothetical protein
VKTTITLGDMVDKGVRVLVAAASGTGVSRSPGLIAEHARDGGGRLAQLIAADCPRMPNPAADIYDRCGVHFSRNCRIGSVRWTPILRQPEPSSKV